MAKRTKKPYRDHDEDFTERLKEPKFAYQYLKAALEEKDMPEVFMDALSHIAKARGVRQIAAHTKLNRESLYRILSKEGNPTLTSLHAILDALGLKLSVEPKKRAV
jgi:probable addiction module antidote protein